MTPACASFRIIAHVGWRHAHKYKEGPMGLLEVGSEAPDFQVKDHTGKDVKLSNLRGKTVVLWFYPKADTPG